MSEKENAVSHHKGNISKYFDFNLEMPDFYFFFSRFFFLRWVQGFRTKLITWCTKQKNESDMTLPQQSTVDVINNW